jgi:EAL domain-containing protein (putative c-di-GMP-specific phosphodiesterase class I)
MALARQVVQAMHQAGARVVLDDFGTGYANLLPLRELPFDRIKIDRGFIRDMLFSARTDACLRAILGLARSLGTSIIAEGVETEAAERRLREMGCEFAQGYYYSPPVPAEGVPLLVRREEMRIQSRAVAA